MKQSTKNQVKGNVHEVKGKVKETVGRATNNPDMEAEGQGETIGGKVQKKNRPSGENPREINSYPY